MAQVSWTWAVLLVLAYLAGSLPTGLWVGRLTAGVDVRSLGSRRTGATNVQRVVGLRAGLMVAAMDVAKGLVPVLLVRAITGNAYLAAVAGVLTVVGHVWPVFAGFDGGRGVSTTAGALAALAPVPFLCCFLVMVAAVAVTRYVSLGSLAAAYTAGPFTAFWLGRSPETDAALVVAVVAGALVALKHPDNVHRLLHGTERRFGGKREPVAISVEPRKEL
ncbi:MAG: acyl phosphate:glycerol-3-phosphate acyltransferase [Chloroflexota bacterium]|jgi:glycerol-3-phosphate acyltransferase PlsY|nr:acyl phosphate:glycerol-3-phosphate acyltransferase [Chloroflexota bacterium]